MRENLIAILPEIRWIKNRELQECILASYQEVLEIAGLNAENMDRIAFNWREFPNASISYIRYVKAVTRMCKSVAAEHSISYAEQVGYCLSKLPKHSLDHDTLIAGALLHDIGKLLEYELLPDGRTIKSKMGKYLRHPFAGVAVAYKNRIPDYIIHIIATHSKEGEGGYRSPESIELIKIITMILKNINSK
ncbi:HD domain-containing protein [bacterium BFN5]|nr:HD domain-containing protein [bacterium BFN5]QJW45516.1 HD domain-containing protein [bacterium BFN5]